MTTPNTTITNSKRFVSLGYSIESHKVIEKEAREALARLQHYYHMDTEAGLEDAKRVIHALMSRSVDAINFDIEHGG